MWLFLPTSASCKCQLGASAISSRQHPEPIKCKFLSRMCNHETDGKIYTVPLHEHKKYTHRCAEVLNEEWPRSLTARRLMLEKSNVNYPFSIVLLEKTDYESEVIGHSRLCKVHGNDKACFVESVVVSKNRRGQGLGRKLMMESEKHAQVLGCKTVYLTTHDKCDFYQHVGYAYCDPIISFGSASNLISEQMAKALFGSPTTSKSSITIQNKPPTDPQLICTTVSYQASPMAPPPPPVAPPPPPKAPPPPLGDKTVTRLDPSKVYWMKKELKLS